MVGALGDDVVGEEGGGRVGWLGWLVVVVVTERVGGQGAGGGEVFAGEHHALFGGVFACGLGVLVGVGEEFTGGGCACERGGEFCFAGGEVALASFLAAHAGQVVGSCGAGQLCGAVEGAASHVRAE